MKQKRCHRQTTRRFGKVMMKLVGIVDRVGVERQTKVMHRGDEMIDGQSYRAGSGSDERRRYSRFVDGDGR